MFKRSRLALALGGLFAVSTSAHAGLSTTVTATTDYLFDGISQTDNGPALQASLDYAFDNGIYLGTWVSNVDFNECDGVVGSCDEASVEQDWYGGWSFDITDGIVGDVGFAAYTYYSVPSDGYDYTEFYAGLTFFEDTKIKVWMTDEEDVFGTDTDGDGENDKGGKSMRIKANQTLHLSDNWALNLEGTYTKNKDVSDFYGEKSGDSYLHWKVGIATDVEGFNMELSYQDTNISSEDELSENADARIVFAVSRTFDIL